MERLLGSKKMIALFVLPGLIFYLGIAFFPILQTLRYSLTNWNGIGTPSFSGVGNYIHLLLEDMVFWKGVKNSFILLVGAVFGQITPAFFLALFLHHHSRGVRFYKTAFFIPVVLSTAAIALMWNKMYEPNFGMINALFRSIGKTRWEQQWLSDPDAVIYAVTAPIIWQYVGYHMIILYAGLKTIPEQYYEAALIDGASPGQAVLHITLPLLRQVVKVCVVLASIGSLKLFDHIYIMTGGGPFNSSTTVAIHMYKEAFGRMRFGYGSSVAVFLVIECLLISWIINRLMKGENLEY